MQDLIAGLGNIQKNLFIILVTLLVVFILFSNLMAYISYIDIFNWWNNNGGKEFKKSIDLMSCALFNYSNISFKVHQLFVSGPEQINETYVMLLQSICINNIKNNVARSGEYIDPSHICRSIAWGDSEKVEFCQALQEFYNGCDDADYKDTTGLPRKGTDAVIPNKTFCTSKLPGLIKNNTSAYSPDWAVMGSIQPGFPGGFWPHLNGCIGFFDIPNDDGTYKKYDLFQYLPIPRIKNDGKWNRPPWYVPNESSPYGSWAQLFADWGIVYTTLSKAGISRVPVLSDGASCFEKGTLPLNPCPTLAGWCGTCADGDKGTLPDSTKGISTWFDTGINNGTVDASSNGQIGVNFISINNINPLSYILTSWVGDLYDDPTTGIIFDGQAFRNMLGADGSYRKKSDGSWIYPPGGWNRFFRGVNINLTSYDEIMNELFREYATNFTARAADPSGPGCSTTKKFLGIFGGAGAGLIAGLFLGAVLAPFTGGASLAVGVAAAAAGAAAGAATGAAQCAK